MIRSFLVLFTALVLLPAVHGKPNVIVIMGDDMGYSDLGCYGSEIDTPNLDQLAAGGVRFTQFYNTARCCPTRAALLTGLYSHQAGIGWMMSDNGHAGYRGELNNRSVTIAEALKPAGYRTYMSQSASIRRAPTIIGRDNVALIASMGPFTARAVSLILTR